MQLPKKRTPLRKRWVSQETRDGKGTHPQMRGARNRRAGKSTEETKLSRPFHGELDTTSRQNTTTHKGKK